REEQAVARAQLGLRTLRSPIHGVVVERYSNLGERVEDRPVMRIASINPLRVSLMIPMAQFGQIGLGDVMSVRPELPGAAPVQATVQYIDKVVDAASNTFRVRLVLPNPDLKLAGGLRCKADLLSKAATRQPAVAPRPSPASAQVAPSRTSTQPRPARLASAALQLKTSWTLTWPQSITASRRASTIRQTSSPPAANAQPGSGPWLTASVTLRAHR
ncbi:MAG TPA: efflux RND transporter periplasmic adaptor subunit, partial [Aquabacterium sp.]|nr:efflux RND transporter periplasmic adaptor subunit [Aquabacterium sp.]